MKIYVLITCDKTIGGIYSTKAKLIEDLTTTLAATAVSSIEVWDVDSGFVEYLEVSKKTIVTIGE